MLSSGSFRVVFPSNKALYITSVGWVCSLNLGAVLILFEFISTDWLSFQSPWSLCRCLLCRRDVPVCISSLCCLYLVTIHSYDLVWRNLKPESVIPSIVTSSCTLWSSPSTLYSFAEYLMLDDGGCLNALLSVDFIPSNSDHLFWDLNLESFECLETCSHQW